MPNDPYAEFETETDLLTERDKFLERRLVRSGLNKEDPRYREAVESAFSVLDLPDLTSL